MSGADLSLDEGTYTAHRLWRHCRWRDGLRQDQGWCVAGAAIFGAGVSGAGAGAPDQARAGGASAPRRLRLGGRGGRMRQPLKTGGGERMAAQDLRGWIAKMDAAGEIRHISGADREEEIGGIVDVYQRKTGNPAALFDNVPG